MSTYATENIYTPCDLRSMTKTTLKNKTRTRSNDSLLLILSVVLFLLILFSLPTLVGSTSFTTSPSSNRNCNNKGYVNATTGLCECISTYQGHSCEYRVCPHGKSWLAYPTADHVRARPRVECSNMGSCDMRTGVCNCRAGFEGRACERKSCPGGCSGHGRCVNALRCDVVCVVLCAWCSVV